MKIKWDNLKENRCPKCNEYLMWDDDGGIFFCRCSFRISKKRFKEVVNSLVDHSIEGYHRKMEKRREKWQ